MVRPTGISFRNITFKGSGFIDKNNNGQIDKKPSGDDGYEGYKKEYDIDNNGSISVQEAWEAFYSQAKKIPPIIPLTRHPDKRDAIILEYGKQLTEFLRQKAPVIKTGKKNVKDTPSINLEYPFTRNNILTILFRNNRQKISLFESSYSHMIGFDWTNIKNVEDYRQKNLEKVMKHGDMNYELAKTMLEKYPDQKAYWQRQLKSAYVLCGFNTKNFIQDSLGINYPDGSGWDMMPKLRPDYFTNLLDYKKSVSCETIKKTGLKSEQLQKLGSIQDNHFEFHAVDFREFMKTINGMHNDLSPGDKKKLIGLWFSAIDFSRKDPKRFLVNRNAQTGEYSLIPKKERKAFKDKEYTSFLNTVLTQLNDKDSIYILSANFTNTHSRAAREAQYRKSFTSNYSAYKNSMTAHELAGASTDWNSHLVFVMPGIHKETIEVIKKTRKKPQTIGDVIQKHYKKMLHWYVNIRFDKIPYGAVTVQINDQDEMDIRDAYQKKAEPGQKITIKGRSALDLINKEIRKFNLPLFLYSSYYEKPFAQLSINKDISNLANIKPPKYIWETGKLTVTGKMTVDEKKELLSVFTDKKDKKAIGEVMQWSHEGPSWKPIYIPTALNKPANEWAEKIKLVKGILGRDIDYVMTPKKKFSFFKWLEKQGYDVCTSPEYYQVLSLYTHLYNIPLNIKGGVMLPVFKPEEVPEIYQRLKAQMQKKGFIVWQVKAGEMISDFKAKILHKMLGTEYEWDARQILKMHEKELEPLFNQIMKDNPASFFTSAYNKYHGRNFRFNMPSDLFIKKDFLKINSDVLKKIYTEEIENYKKLRNDVLNNLNIDNRLPFDKADLMKLAEGNIAMYMSIFGIHHEEQGKGTSRKKLKDFFLCNEDLFGWLHKVKHIGKMQVGASEAVTVLPLVISKLGKIKNKYPDIYSIHFTGKYEKIIQKLKNLSYDLRSCKIIMSDKYLTGLYRTANYEPAEILSGLKKYSYSLIKTVLSDDKYQNLNILFSIVLMEDSLSTANPLMSLTGINELDNVSKTVMIANLYHYGMEQGKTISNLDMLLKLSFKLDLRPQSEEIVRETIGLIKDECESLLSLSENYSAKDWLKTKVGKYDYARIYRELTPKIMSLIINQLLYILLSTDNDPLYSRNPGIKESLLKKGLDSSALERIKNGLLQEKSGNYLKKEKSGKYKYEQYIKLLHLLKKELLLPSVMTINHNPERETAILSLTNNYGLNVIRFLYNKNEQNSFFKVHKDLSGSAQFSRDLKWDNPAIQKKLANYPKTKRGYQGILADIYGPFPKSLLEKNVFERMAYLAGIDDAFLQSPDVKNGREIDIEKKFYNKVFSSRELAQTTTEQMYRDIPGKDVLENTNYIDYENVITFEHKGRDPRWRYYTGIITGNNGKAEVIWADNKNKRVKKTSLHEFFQQAIAGAVDNGAPLRMAIARPAR
ncbi:hypothetical protein ACFL57_04000 [Candidatus Margulisiibacteriota bacterium]